MSGWMVLVTILLILAATAVGTYPGKARVANRLTAAAAVCMGLTLIVSALYRDNMFTDALAVPSSLWLRALLAVSICVGLGVLLAWLTKGKYR